MPLPHFKRVVFKKNPLYGVSAQMRFHPILRIQVEPPVSFQEAIRPQFPGYEPVNPAAVMLPSGIPAEVQRTILASAQAGLNIGFEQAHRFTSSDRNWAVQMSKDSVILSCKVYPRWEEFRERLRPVIDAFIRAYSPPFALSVALRYQNAIQRSALGLSGVSWSELLKPFVAAEFGCEGIAEADVLSDFHRFEIKENDNRVIVQHGLAKNKETGESVYSIDSNLTSNGKVELTDVTTRLDQLNRHSGSLFRLCITDRLFESLEPIDL
jgi:uncharacterized protein (TIGR04255 family)